MVQGFDTKLSELEVKLQLCQINREMSALKLSLKDRIGKDKISHGLQSIESEVDNYID